MQGKWHLVICVSFQLTLLIVGAICLVDHCHILIGFQCGYEWWDILLWDSRQFLQHSCHPLLCVRLGTGQHLLHISQQLWLTDIRHFSAPVPAVLKEVHRGRCWDRPWEARQRAWCYPVRLLCRPIDDRMHISNAVHIS